MAVRVARQQTDGKRRVSIMLALVIIDHVVLPFEKKPTAAVSVSLRGIRRSSDVDVERARLLHHHALRPDAERLADLCRDLA
jgi:hypothetical protein